MKVLWLVNTIFPYPAKMLGSEVSCFGGWAHSLFESLNKNKDLKFAIVSTYTGKILRKFEEKNNIYYLIPNKNENKYNKKLGDYWKDIIEEFKPDVVHIHGTEYPKSLPLIKSYPNLNYVVSIQGLLTPYSRVYNANLEFKNLLKNITLRDILKPKTGLFIKNEVEHRMKYEIEILKNVKNVIGRTTWDKANAYAINPKINYYHGEENLRECFYKDNWNIKDVKRHTIFFSQAQSIIKGFYIMVEALKIIKYKYPDVKVIVAGNNIFDESNLKAKLKKQSYTKYLKKLVDKFDLKDNIEFTGFLNASEYKKYLINSNVYVQASAIENSSNSLGEAMILGVPCVASNVGGTSDMLLDKKEGFLYPYTEPELLAHYVQELFENDKLCEEIGKNAREHALKRHNWENNAKTTMNIYNNIIK